LQAGDFGFGRISPFSLGLGSLMFCLGSLPFHFGYLPFAFPFGR
jgi:hypothetical protein